jgi:hypothetical protein
VKAVLLMAASLSLSPTLASAQSALVGTFKLPMTAHWSQAVLPAGEYSFYVELLGAGPLVTVRSADRKWAAMFICRSTSPVEEGTTNHNLLLVRRGEEMFVSSFRLSELGLELEYNLPKVAATNTVASLSEHRGQSATLATSAH